MCTVTFLPRPSGVLITSNRDEKIQRQAALPPAGYLVNGVELIFPKDQDAAGTWIAMRGPHQFAVLLNGACQKHQPAYPYAKSRGLIFLDIFSKPDLSTAFASSTFTNIEPFTLILFDRGRLTANRWDGLTPLIEELPSNQPHIWSSVTLYDHPIIKAREKWFAEWRQLHPKATAADILQFHQFGGQSDNHNNIRMNRNGEMLTVSITCIDAQAGKAIMHYTDLQNSTTNKHELVSEIAL
jgi:Transport and Golgi organisation 2